jgi:Ornithine/acetylornithine aminotransferase
LLLIDSIQAGLRAHGVLSITDYPGFEKLPAPDMETFSKALNGGQYPLSVLAVSARTAGLYRKGIYGNTMTANPRALDVALATIGQLSDDVRSNIRERGKEFVDKLNALKNELGGLITKVQGTGLLFSCELAPEYKCYGADSTEEYMREHGIGVIHGGVNSLRFTRTSTSPAPKSIWSWPMCARPCWKARARRPPRPRLPEQPFDRSGCGGARHVSAAEYFLHVRFYPLP